MTLISIEYCVNNGSSSINEGNHLAFRDVLKILIGIKTPNKNKAISRKTEEADNLSLRALLNTDDQHN